MSRSWCSGSPTARSPASPSLRASRTRDPRRRNEAARQLVGLLRIETRHERREFRRWVLIGRTSLFLSALIVFAEVVTVELWLNDRASDSVGAFVTALYDCIILSWSPHGQPDGHGPHFQPARRQSARWLRRTRPRRLTESASPRIGHQYRCSDQPETGRRCGRSSLLAFGAGPRR